MNKDRERELLKQEVMEYMERQKEIALNPLCQYSTTQLKKELRRRKKNGEK